MVEIEEVAPAAPAQGPGAHAFQGTPKKRGNAAFRNGDYAGAVELYAAALEEEGNAPSHTTLCNRSASLFMLGRLEESLADAERADHEDERVRHHDHVHLVGALPTARQAGLAPAVEQA